jgi:serine/threonine protein kinase
VVEYCDLGNLTSAIRSQIFNLPPAGAGRHAHSRHASRSSRHSGYESGGGYDSSTDGEGSSGADSAISSPGGGMPGVHGSGGNAIPPGRLRVNVRWLLLTLLEVAEGMAYLHRMGVVHCDLKPANVSTARQILIPFFGASCLFADVEQSLSVWICCEKCRCTLGRVLLFAYCPAATSVQLPVVIRPTPMALTSSCITCVAVCRRCCRCC